jgi:hypothetical protein
MVQLHVSIGRHLAGKACIGTTRTERCYNIGGATAPDTALSDPIAALESLGSLQLR